MRTKKEIELALQRADADYDGGTISLAQYEDRLEALEKEKRALNALRLEQNQMLRED